MTDNFRCGFVAIVGRPNAGKSTLINALVAEKVSIVTPAPQTTRNRILGVLNRPGAQVVFVDTPGIHKPFSRLNQQMMAFVREALEGRSLALLVVDAAASFGHGDMFAVELLKQYHTRAILVLNKIDLLRKSRLLPLIQRYSELYPFDEIIPASALKSEGLDELLTAVIERLPAGEPLFPADYYTDQPSRFLASEIIREKVILHTKQELPYVTAVLIDEFSESERITRIRARIVVEKESQKPIVIGADGARIKQIGTEARLELERIFPPRVYLDLRVDLEPAWRNNRAVVSALDYRGEAGNR
ncbi:MAG: GTPase Era [Terriglobia bacterium]